MMIVMELYAFLPVSVIMIEFQGYGNNGKIIWQFFSACLCLVKVLEEFQKLLKVVFSTFDSESF